MSPRTRLLIIAALIGVVIGFSLGRVAKLTKKYHLAKVQQLQSRQTTVLEQMVKGVMP